MAQQIDLDDVIGVEGMGDQWQVTIYDIDGGDLIVGLWPDEADAVSFRDSLAEILGGWINGARR